MKIAYLADASLHHAIVLGLRLREPMLDILSANDARLEGVDDQEVLAKAARMGRILASSDRKTMPAEFAAFLQNNPSSPGVFLISQKVPIATAIEELRLIWAASEASEWRDCICPVPLPR